jgi:hypothetical protein
MGDEDWDGLARILHKLRPVLCYCGINSLTDRLLLVENNAREKKDMSQITGQVSALLNILEQVHDELKGQLASLSE